jgi:hypothetical protein
VCANPLSMCFSLDNVGTIIERETRGPGSGAVMSRRPLRLFLGSMSMSTELSFKPLYLYTERGTDPEAENGVGTVDSSTHPGNTDWLEVFEEVEVETISFHDIEKFILPFWEPWIHALSSSTLSFEYLCACQRRN